MGRDKGVKQTDTARGREGAKTEKQGERGRRGRAGETERQARTQRQPQKAADTFACLLFVIDTPNMLTVATCLPCPLTAHV